MYMRSYTHEVFWSGELISMPKKKGPAKSEA
jgi:hypothetical protein